LNRYKDKFPFEPWWYTPLHFYSIFNFLPQDLATEELQIEEILDAQNLTAEEKKESIVRIKSFVTKHRENSSIKTIFSCANTMIGSVCLILPLIFNSSGIFTSLIILVVVCVISMKTCDLLLIHVKEEEEDLPALIARLLGNYYSKVFCLASGLLLCIVVIIYYLLLANMAYLIITFIINHWDPTAYVSSKTFSFSKFSFQWASVVALAVAAILANLKKIAFIVKLGHYGVICLYIYTVFIIYIAIDNIVNGNFETKKSEINYVTNDIANLAGTFALSYMLHNAVIPIVKQNKHQEKNTRDIRLAFLLTSFIYCIIGFFGCLGIVGKSTPDGSAPSTVMDFFEKDDVLPFLIEIIFASHLLTSFPIVNYLARTQILQLWFHYERIPNLYSYIFNFCMLSVCLVFGIFNVSPGIVIAIDGAVVGFFIIYVIPVKLHLKCLYEKEEKEKGTTSHESVNAEREIYMSLVDRPDCDHSKHKRFSKKTRYVFYSVIMLIGIAFMVVQIEEFIRGFFK